jgi:glycosyl transferase/beta-hydroxylase protein BlmF
LAVSKVFLIGTAHQQYRQRSFEPGSVVIDPWRMIPDQTGVTVRRLGENRPALISILVPSRGRPAALLDMVGSALSTATFPRLVEIVAYLDDDDEARGDYFANFNHASSLLSSDRVLLNLAPRILLSSAWNALVPLAKGEILMHGGDDLVFRTPGWDQQVRDAFAASDDKILLVQGDDLSPNREALATHGFVHRRWVETVGYFLPPLFSCDWNDVWLTEVADAIGRRVMLPFVTEHQHHSFGKRDRDQTDSEREQRGADDDVVGLFNRTKQDRVRDAAKLRAVMA